MFQKVCDAVFQNMNISYFLSYKLLELFSHYYIIPWVKMLRICYTKRFKDNKMYTAIEDHDSPA
jgi:hypothetical protein